MKSVRHLRYLCEAVPIYGAYGLLRLLPHHAAGSVLSILAGIVGRHTRPNRRAMAHLQAVLPELSDGACQEICRNMWRNLGRMVAEFPHVPEMRVVEDAGQAGDIVVEGADILRKLHTSGKPVIFISGHIGNWEVLGKVSAYYSMPFVSVYRAANNPYLEPLILRTRRGISAGFAPKGAYGARVIVKAVKDGKHLGFLLDQKMNDGIAVPFFGRSAMTPPGAVDLAVKYSVPLVPAYCLRRADGRLQVVVEPPLSVIPRVGETAAALRYRLLVEINQHLERWIRKDLSGWLWMHRRWPAS